MSPSRRPRTRRAPAPVAPRPRRRRRRARGNGKRLALVGVLVLLVAAVGVAASAAVLTFRPRCDLSALKPVKIGENTFVYAADGSLLGAIPAERNREVVPLRSMSPWLTRATVAIEDRRFYSHGGVDAEGIARALWSDVKAGRVVEGGSTITQQLVRTLYISNERTVERKVTEACLAVKLDGERSKDWILANYLNSVFYGNFAYGAEAAARTYFSRSARSLTLPQAALVAGLTQAPSAYDPFADPRQAVARRDQVLLAMRDEGMITRAQYRWARASRSPGLRPGRLYQEIREPYFFGYVRDQLVREYGAETVRSGGLRVYTTIQPRWQKLAQTAIRGTLTAPNDPAAALISIDPASGSIRAMTAIVPGRAEQPVQPPLAGETAARLDVQDLRPRRGRREGDGPDCGVLRLGAVHLSPGRQRDVRAGLVVRQDVRLELRRLELGGARDAALGQQRLSPSSRSTSARRPSRRSRVASG